MQAARAKVASEAPETNKPASVKGRVIVNKPAAKAPTAAPADPADLFGDDSTLVDGTESSHGGSVSGVKVKVEGEPKASAGRKVRRISIVGNA